MQLTTNEVIDAIHNLPSSEREKIRRLLEKETAEKNRQVDEQVARFKESEAWLAEHRDEYLGQWVCLLGNELIAAGDDGQAVFAEAKARGIESPYLVRVVEEPKNFTGAWL